LVNTLQYCIVHSLSRSSSRLAADLALERAVCGCAGVPFRTFLRRVFVLVGRRVFDE
jgi:hypothetical protein